jgi:hypothetical protein
MEDCANVKAPPRSIERSTKDLESQITNVEKGVSSLHDRLSDILGPVGPDSPSPDKQQPESCAFATGISGFTDRLYKVSDHLESLLSRIEL